MKKIEEVLINLLLELTETEQEEIIGGFGSYSCTVCYGAPSSSQGS